MLLRTHALACFAVVAASAALSACASPAPPAPATPTPAASEGAPAAAASAPPSAPAPEGPTAAQQRPLDLASFCPHALRLYYGEQPGDGKGTNVTINTSETLPVPRNPDGTVVIWVVDDQGQGLASVHVTRRMKHVSINADCSRIDAN